MTLSGRCFKAVFGIPSGPGALPTLLPRMVPWTSVGLVSLGSIAGAKEYAHIVSLTTSMTAGTEGSFTGYNYASKLSARVSGFSESERASPPGLTRRGDGVGTLITRLPIFHSEWSSRSRLSSVLLHWSSLHSLSWLVTDFWRLTLAFRAGSLVIYHCLLNRVFRCISYWVQASNGGRGSSRGGHLGVESANAFEIALDSSSTCVNSHLIREVRSASRQAWNLDWSVLKSGHSGGLRKDDWHQYR